MKQKIGGETFGHPDDDTILLEGTSNAPLDRPRLIQILPWHHNRFHPIDHRDLVSAFFVQLWISKSRHIQLDQVELIMGFDQLGLLGVLLLDRGLLDGTW